MSSDEMERASLAMKKIYNVHPQNQDFQPAEEAAAEMTACVQAASYQSLGCVRTHKKKVHFEKQNKYHVPPQNACVLCVSDTK